MDVAEYRIMNTPFREIEYELLLEEYLERGFQPVVGRLLGDLLDK